MPGLITIDLANHTGQVVQLLLYHELPDVLVARDYTPPYHIEYTGAAGLYYLCIYTESGYTYGAPYTLRATFP